MSATSRPPPAIPLSPPSPPDTGVKERSKHHYTDNAPDSPASPPLMSVATKSYASSSFLNSQPSSEAVASQNTYSSATTMPTSSPPPQPPFSPSANPLSPPTKRTAEDLTADTLEEGDGHRSKRPRMESTEVQEGKEGSDLPKSPTNHDRQAEESGGPTGEAAEKSSVNAGENMQQLLPPGDGSLEAIQKEMKDSFLLCRSTLPRSLPDPSQHLLSLYGLSPLHASVARTDPVTGLKINRLRRSYEGQIKNLHLPGRNKPMRAQLSEDGRGPLRLLAEEPDSEKDDTSIEVTSHFRTLLAKAMHMRPGPVRNNEHWEDVLGHEKPRALPGAADTPHPPVRASANLPPPPPPPPPPPARMVNGATRAAGEGGGEAIRPRRLGKKRSYADDSFEGYAGFDEEGDLDAGPQEESDGGGMGRKKRKKEHHPTSISPGPS